MIIKKEQVSFIAKGGVRLNGLRFHAKDASISLLLVLGLGGDAKSDSVEYFAKALANKGISTIVFSARGHGDSEGLFFFQKNISDIQELEKKYSSLAKNNNSSFVMLGHSIGGRSMLCANLSSDIILVNPTLYRSHSMLVTLPIIRRLYLLWWNYFVFRKFSITHFGNIYFTNESFKDLIQQTSHQDFSTTKQKGRCLLLISSHDIVARYNKTSIQDKVQFLLRKRYSHLYYTLFSGLDHEFSDGSRTFMRTEQLSKIISHVVTFSKGKYD